MQKLRYIVYTTYFITIQIFAGVDVDSTLEQINNSIAINAIGFNLSYKEKFLPTDIPGLKSTEAGNVIGVSLDVRNTWADKIYTDLYLEYCKGTLEYDGSTQPKINPVTRQIINPQPLTFDMTHKFFTANLKAGPVFTFTDNDILQVIPYIGIE